MNRREFLKISAALGAGYAMPALLGGCAPRPLPGTGAVTASPTVCNMCFWQCAGTLYQEDGQPWKVVGNPDDPHCEGRLCTRGTAGIGAYSDPDRLRQPLLRVSEGGAAHNVDKMAEDLKEVRKDVNVVGLAVVAAPH